MNICTPDGACNGGDLTFTTLAEAKAFVTVQANAWSCYLRNKLIGPVSPFEAASWWIKVAEAKMYPICPTLDYEAAQRGISTQDLATKVLAQATQLQFMEAKIAGLCGKHKDAIKALTTIEEVCAYDWRFEV